MSAADINELESVHASLLVLAIQEPSRDVRHRMLAMAEKMKRAIGGLRNAATEHSLCRMERDQLAAAAVGDPLPPFIALDPGAMRAGVLMTNVIDKQRVLAAFSPMAEPERVWPMISQPVPRSVEEARKLFGKWCAVCGAVLPDHRMQTCDAECENVLGTQQRKLSREA